jgi:hypothetical protein
LQANRPAFRPAARFLAFLVVRSPRRLAIVRAFSAAAMCAAAVFLFVLWKGFTMTQSRLNRAVARATGESLSTIRRLGFSMIEPDALEYDHEPAVPNVVDWDDVDSERVVLFPVCLARAA